MDNKEEIIAKVKAIDTPEMSNDEYHTALLQIAKEYGTTVNTILSWIDEA